MKAVLGMSGGVDSSLAAFLLKEAGYEVIGVSLLMFEARGKPDPAACCSRESIADAADSCARIGIPHEVISARALFMEKVVGPFVEAYLRGITPNPCILCNRFIKFPLLIEKARAMGAEFISTGHYARIERPQAEGARLLKGIDPAKDQSYVLYALRPEELERLVLPLGAWTKAAVRESARSLGLKAFDRPESQEICFVEGRDYGGFIRALGVETPGPGPMRDDSGATVGVHKGIIHYTIGQRKGVGVSRPYPLYVYAIDAGENTVWVGPRERALRQEFEVKNVNWLIRKTAPFRVGVKVRSTMPEHPATVTPTGEDAVHVSFDLPQWAPAPGQAAVFYEGDTVIGGGEIDGEIK